MKKIIFYIPMKLNRNTHSASQIRPLKILDAFRKVGYEVDVVEGDVKDRKNAIKSIKRKIKGGVKYDFLYSESSTMPTLLTERNHLPFHPFMDFDFFYYCKKQNIPIGLFYRDIYWCFQKNIKSWKNKIAYYFYKYDINQYNKYVDVLFVPSLEMLNYIPENISCKTYSLPSGTEIHTLADSNRDDKINILYVGGIGGDYNLKMLVEAVSKNENIKLTMCVRDADWNNVKEEYNTLVNNNIEVVLPKDQNLNKLYSSAHLFCLFIEPCEYRKFAVPFKMIEAIGYGVPLLASKGTYCGDFVTKNNIGLTIKYDIKELGDTLNMLISDPTIIDKYSKNIKEIQEENTWVYRVEEIRTELLK